MWRARDNVHGKPALPIVGDYILATNILPGNLLGRGTNTGLAIRYVVDMVFNGTTLAGDRTDVPNKVLLITDGRARDPPILRVEAPRLQEKATVYALGIGKQIDYVELNRIASDPSERHVLYVDNFSFLERAFQKPTLSSIFCDEVCLK